MRQNHTSSSKAPRPTVKARHKRTQGDAEASKTAGASATKPPQVEVAHASTPAAPPRDSSRGVARFDRPGHLAHEHAERLLRLSRRDVQKDREQGFDWAAGDDLAAELGEFAVISMVGGGETWLDLVDGPVEEDDGGPFVETQSSREFAPGSDEDSEGFLREALPTSSALAKGASPEFRRRRPS